MINKIICDKYFKCKHSSTDHCYECNENKNLENHFEEMKQDNIEVYSNKEDIIGILDSIKIYTKVEVTTGDLIIIGFIEYEDKEHIVVHVNNAERYNYTKNRIDKLKLLYN
jgi:hypothetical protein